MPPVVEERSAGQGVTFLRRYGGLTFQSGMVVRFRRANTRCYVLVTAEHPEPCDARGSCTVLGAPGGGIPPGDST